MRALKAFVIGMGVLLLAGFIVVGYVIIQRAGESASSDDASKSAPSPIPAAPVGATATGLAAEPSAREPIPPVVVPEGAVLREIVPAGRHVVLHFGLPNGDGTLRILDLHAGGEALDVEIKAVP